MQNPQDVIIKCLNLGSGISFIKGSLAGENKTEGKKLHIFSPDENPATLQGRRDFKLLLMRFIKQGIS